MTDGKADRLSRPEVKKPVKLVQEGVLIECNRMILPGAITWGDEPLPVLMGYHEEVVGTFTNIRREDGWVVGDVVMNIENPDWYDHGVFLTHVSYDDGDESLRVVTKGTLRADMLYPKPALYKTPLKS